MTRDRSMIERRSSKSSYSAPRSLSKRRLLRQRVTNRTQNMAKSDSPNRRIKTTRSAAQLKNAVKLVKQVAQKPFFRDWRGVAALSLAVTGGLTILSLGFLLKLPAVPNCPSIFWPFASASLRLHCAQLAANKRTANDLLEAIKLVNMLPPNHPLYEEAKRFVEQWSRDILDLGEEAFQAGKLGEAIDTAKKVPKSSGAYPEVEGKIKRWQGIWSSAEAVYRRAEDALRKQNWQQASTEASRLLSIDNTFWQTTKYQELTDKIAMTREDIIKLAKARKFLNAGGLKNFQEAIKLASNISDKSYVYKGAQELLAKIGQEMFELAEATLDRKDLSGALDIAKQIPAAANLQRQVEDFEKIANAQSRAWNGSLEDIESAIAELQRIGSDRPLRSKAQNLIARLQLEKSDVAILTRARQLAQTGRAEDVQAAIASASQIPASNPRYEEARDFVAQLTGEVQTKEDRPLLDQADQLAAQGDQASLQSAINALNRITPGRSLYEDARRKQQQYTQQLRQMQERERSLAEATQSPSPIATPSFDDSQDALRQQERAFAERSLQSAREAASGNSVDALAEAIRRADGVGVASPYRREAEQLMNQWSQQMLQAALSQADVDVSGAIATAQKIPPGTDAYSQAQLQIQVWRRSLGQ